MLGSRIDSQSNREEASNIGSCFAEHIIKSDMERGIPSIHSESQYIRCSTGRGRKEWDCRSLDGKFHMENSSH